MKNLAPVGEIFGDLRCDSLLPESIPDCKSVEIAQNFPPPAGSFSETSKKIIKIFASGGVLTFNYERERSRRTPLTPNYERERSLRPHLTFNYERERTRRPLLTSNYERECSPPPLTSHYESEAPQAALFHNITSNFDRNFSEIFWIRLEIWRNSL